MTDITPATIGCVWLMLCNLHPGLIRCHCPNRSTERQLFFLDDQEFRVIPFSYCKCLFARDLHGQMMERGYFTSEAEMSVIDGPIVAISNDIMKGFPSFIERMGPFALYTEYAHELIGSLEDFAFGEEIVTVRSPKYVVKSEEKFKDVVIKTIVAALSEFNPCIHMQEAQRKDCHRAKERQSDTGRKRPRYTM
ncbi:hypothetical protein FISHEDRAFT_78023 [Fistulina hepatica ATCC 64428]|nr:hypothetical protein FISHEDRAFT_78023 [Fistulina hepatica ATCC 64428]